jgi:hypothetical protein
VVDPSGVVTSPKTKAIVRGWRQSTEAVAFLEELITFREKLREAVVRIETGSVPTDVFLAEVNSLLRQHPHHTSSQARRKGCSGDVVRAS